MCNLIIINVKNNLNIPANVNINKPEIDSTTKLKIPFLNSFLLMILQ